MTADGRQNAMKKKLTRTQTLVVFVSLLILRFQSNKRVLAASPRPLFREVTALEQGWRVER